MMQEITTVASLSDARHLKHDANKSEGQERLRARWTFITLA